MCCDKNQCLQGCINYYETKQRKYICLYCSRHEKTSGRNNGNFEHNNLDGDIFFQTVDTEQKAYILGWIASDGTVSISGFVIEIHDKDQEIPEKLRDVDQSLSLSFREKRCILRVNSKKISVDC